MTPALGHRPGNLGPDEVSDVGPPRGGFEAAAAGAIIAPTMRVPAVKYASTSDGYRIAYADVGEGRPLVLMPWPILGLALWRAPDARPLLDALSGRFRLIHFDRRGQGLSTRGLPGSHDVEDYILDLQAVVNAAGLDRFVLFGTSFLAHVAVRFAAEHPDRVEALILDGMQIQRAWDNALAHSDLARSDWDLFLHTFSSSFWIGPDRGNAYALNRESWEQTDFLTMARAAEGFNAKALLSRLEAPVLLAASRHLAPGRPFAPGGDDARSVAALIPNVRLVFFEYFGSYLASEGSEPPALVTAIQAFLADLSDDGQPRRTSKVDQVQSGLSPRQREVLGLIAGGMTNREIAEALVLSERTVQRHIADIYAKIGARNRAEATAFALGRPSPTD
jgi:pimeloyl-ACP methyl ester carboxylesterase/DNA-binding CsgD family transcriptional regulator